MKHWGGKTPPPLQFPYEKARGKKEKKERVGCVEKWGGGRGPHETKSQSSSSLSIRLLGFAFLRTRTREFRCRQWRHTLRAIVLSLSLSPTGLDWKNQHRRSQVPTNHPTVETCPSRMPRCSRPQALEITTSPTKNMIIEKAPCQISHGGQWAFCI